MSRALVVGIVALLVSGCAMVWTKPGATDNDYYQDTYACERDVRQTGYHGGGLAGAISMQDFFARCMRAKGWTGRRQ